jgi:mannose-6-phosphate isomerase-like protein (cupin superfamily)
MERSASELEKDRIRDQWAQRGFTCDLWIDPPRQVWPGAQHEVDVVLRLLEGEAQIELPGRTVRMHPGDEIDIPAGARHTVRNCNGHPARWLRGYRQGEAATGA